jgi:hypothetical protein
MWISTIKETFSMPVNPENITKRQYPNSIPRVVWDDQYTFDNFAQNPTASKKAGGASSGTTGAVNTLATRTSNFEYAILGAGQTITAPQTVELSPGLSSLNCELDPSNNEGLEICAGILSNNPNAFQVGSAKSFFLRTRLKLGVVANTDDCAIGFRKAEAFQANIDDYADMAVLNVISGDIKIETIVGGAATVTTDTTDNWADGDVKDLEVIVDENGAVTYSINGNEPTVVADYTFTDGLTVVPFLYFLHANGAAVVTSVINFDIDFVASNSILATINAVGMTPVIFSVDQATTIAAVAAMIATNPVVASATVTGARQITVVFDPSPSNTVTSVVTTLGASQAVATITETADATVGIRLLEWECGLLH